MNRAAKLAMFGCSGLLMFPLALASCATVFNAVVPKSAFPISSASNRSAKAPEPIATVAPPMEKVFVDEAPVQEAPSSTNDEGAALRARFERELLGASQPYVAFVAEFLPRKPHDIDVQLEKSWGALSVREQRDVMDRIAGQWFEIVEKHSTNAEKPRVWFKNPDGSNGEMLEPQKLQWN